jgi:hypothetical protein
MFKPILVDEPAQEHAGVNHVSVSHDPGRLHFLAVRSTNFAKDRPGIADDSPDRGP